MTAERSSALFGPFVAVALLGVFIAFSASNVRAANFSWLAYALANLIVYTDAFDFLLRLHVRRRHVASSRRSSETTRGLSIDIAKPFPDGARHIEPTRPYAIVASVFNLDDKLDDFMAAFAPYRRYVWVISDGSTDLTVKRLRQQGWRCVEERVNRKKPAALRRLLEKIPPHIETVLVVDPDMRIRDPHTGSGIDLEQVIRDFQQSGAAAACPRITLERDGFLSRFQMLEYALSFGAGRQSLADYSITSGVSLYRRDALENALARHSLSVYAEDLENALILLGLGERIYYDGRLVVSTEGPTSWAQWFSQRVGWYYGLVKVYTERLSEIRRVALRTPFAMYHYVVYTGILLLVWHVAKMVSAVLLLTSLASGLDSLLFGGLIPMNAVTNPVHFVSAAGGYVVLGVLALFTVVPKQERSYVAPIIPLYLCYTVVHIAPMSLGFGNWITLKLFRRRLYRDHYELDGRDEAFASVHREEQVL
ncbi:MAG: glycosyltransferase family 2 protein [Gammaproteobacteria bacterium]